MFDNLHIPEVNMYSDVWKLIGFLNKLSFKTPEIYK